MLHLLYYELFEGLVTLRGFSGFPARPSGITQVPDEFFTQLLPLIDDPHELKVTIYGFWAVQQREGEYRFIRARDLREDTTLLAGLHEDTERARLLLDHALERAIVRGTFLHARIVPARGAEAESIYFFNTERGRNAIAALDRGDWTPQALEQPLSVKVDRPNIFKLYEQNIGAITPILAEILREAQDSFPQEWIDDAIRLALENNKRNWRYIEAILKRWSTEGRPNPQGKQPVQDTAHRYLADEYFPKDNFLDLVDSTEVERGSSDETDPNTKPSTDI